MSAPQATPLRTQEIRRAFVLLAEQHENAADMLAALVGHWQRGTLAETHLRAAADLGLVLQGTADLARILAQRIAERGEA